jgi:hypothetical protein
VVTQNPTIRIAVLGTHSTGKTMLLKRIEMELRGHGITVARTGGLARRAAALGLPKMQHHTVPSAEWIITQGVADEIAAAAQGVGAVVVGSAAYDAIAYLRAALELRGEIVQQAEMERLMVLAATQASKYDLLLATVLDQDAHLETGHDDARYRRLVDRHVHALLNGNEIPHQRVTSEEHSKSAAIERALRLCLKEAPA